METRTPDSQWTGRYSDSTDQENEITPLHERFPGDFGLSCLSILYLNISVILSSFSGNLIS